LAAIGVQRPAAAGMLTGHARSSDAEGLDGHRWVRSR